MGWWTALGDLLRGGKNVAEVFVENRENRGARQHEQWLADLDRDRAALQQFAAEFHARQNRTAWDAFVDGLNRLPRPLLTLAIIGFFVLAPLDPARFLLIAQAYELIPAGYWALLSVMIGFYFGGRMQLKAQDMAVRKDAVRAAREERRKCRHAPAAASEALTLCARFEANVQSVSKTVPPPMYMPPPPSPSSFPLCVAHEWRSRRDGVRMQGCGEGTSGGTASFEVNVHFVSETLPPSISRAPPMFCASREGAAAQAQ